MGALIRNSLWIFAAILSAQTSFETIQIIPPQNDASTGEIRFREKWGSASGQYVGLRAPAAIGSSIIWQLPDADGTAGQCLTTTGGAALTFADCGTGTPAGLPVSDTTGIVKGSVDATKVMRFEVDGLTASITRVLTVPDADITIMGRENNETITGTKTFDSNILFATDNTRYIGSDTVRPIRMYARSLDAAPAGVAGDTNNYTKVRKFEIADYSGGITFWELRTFAPGTASSLTVRDNAGAEPLRLERNNGIATTNNAIFDMNVVPLTDNARTSGNALFRWSEVHSNIVFTKQWYMQTINDSAADKSWALRDPANADQVQFITRESNIDVSYAKAYVDWTPDVNVTRDLGNGARRWKKLWVHDIDMTGAVIGGAGDYVTLTTNQTITGQKTFSPIGSLRTAEPMIVKVSGEGGQIDWEDDNGNWAYVNDVAGGSYFRLYRVASGGATFQVFALDGSPFNTEIQGGLHVRDYLRSFTNNAVDIGQSATRFSTIYGYNFDGAPAGELGNFVRTRKVDLVDYVAGGGLLFDLRAAVSTGTGVPGAHRYMEARDNAGNPLYQLWRQQDGVPVNYSKWYQDFIPDTNNSRTMGNGSFRWSNVFGEIGNFNAIYQRDWKLIPYVPDANNSSWFLEDNYGTRQVEFVTREAGSDVVYAKAYVHWLPATDNTYTLGDAFRKWSTAYINNLQVVDVVGTGNFGTSGMLSGSTVTAAVVLTTQWSQQATMNTGSDQRWEFRDPSGVKQIEWVTREGGFDVQYARVAGDLTPDQNATYTLGNAVRRWNTIWGTVGNFSSTVASTGYISNGNTGMTTTLSCGAGQAIKSIVVNGGIVLNVVCGAP